MPKLTHSGTCLLWLKQEDTLLLTVTHRDTSMQQERGAKQLLSTIQFGNRWTFLWVVWYVLWKDGNGFCCLTIRKRDHTEIRQRCRIARHTFADMKEHTREMDGAVERCMCQQTMCDFLPSYSCHEWDNPLRLQDLVKQQNKPR